LVIVLWVIIGACALGLSASLMFTKAASRSPLWNIGFAVALVVAAASLLFVGLVFVVRRLFPNL